VNIQKNVYIIVPVLT